MANMIGSWFIFIFLVHVYTDAKPTGKYKINFMNVFHMIKCYNRI